VQVIERELVDLHAHPDEWETRHWIASSTR
jgi:hypothetical protein